jgi:hypothetical protein
MGNISYLEQPHYELGDIALFDATTGQNADSIKLNKNFYFEKFKIEGFIGFKEASVSEEEQKEIFKLFCKNFDIVPNLGGYRENHNLSISRESGKVSRHNILVSWHYEHIENNIETAASCWNMTKFDCDKSNGITLFCDGQETMHAFNEEEIDFLKKCLVITNHKNEEDKNYRSPIRINKTNNSELIRIDPAYIVEKLVSFDGRKPSITEISRYIQIQKKFENLLLPGSGYIKGWAWSPGDLLIIDLFRMCHAVLGGFEPHEREFIGIFGKVPQ